MIIHFFLDDLLLFCGIKLFSFSILDTASDYYHFNDLLTPEEQAVRKRVREFMEKEVAPIMTEVICFFDIFGCDGDMFFIFVYLIISLCHIIVLVLIFTHQYWEKAEFPFHIIPKFGALGVVGGSIKVISNA